jgi:hypothetical protein
MVLTLNGALLDSAGAIGPAEFESIMRRELSSYVLTRLTDFSDCRTAADLELTNTGALKTLVSEVLVLTREQRAIRRELRDVMDCLQLSSLSSGSEVPAVCLTDSSSPVPQAFDIRNAGIFKAGTGPIPSASCPRVLPFIPAPALAAPSKSGTASNPTTSALQLSQAAPQTTTICPTDIQPSDGLNDGWVAAGAVQDRVAKETESVMSAIDSLTIEVAGMVSGFCGRAAEMSNNVAASRASRTAPQQALAPAAVQVQSAVQGATMRGMTRMAPVTHSAILQATALAPVTGSASDLHRIDDRERRMQSDFSQGQDTVAFHKPAENLPCQRFHSEMVFEISQEQPTIQDTPAQ